MTPASAASRPRRDRHGRGRRGPMAWPPVPAMTTRAEQFDELVLDAAGRMEHRAGTALGDLEFAVEDVPPSDPAPWESSDCLLYTSDAADDLTRVDLGGRGIIKKTKR